MERQKQHSQVRVKHCIDRQTQSHLMPHTSIFEVVFPCLIKERIGSRRVRDVTTINKAKCRNMKPLFRSRAVSALSSRWI